MKVTVEIFAIHNKDKHEIEEGNSQENNKDEDISQDLEPINFSEHCCFYFFDSPCLLIARC